MHAISLLDSWFRRNCSFVHDARIGVLGRVVESLRHGGKATVAVLGRLLLTTAFEKHGIECADRLVSSRRLAGERLGVYQALAQWLLSSVELPWVIIEWSDVGLGHELLMLKAAMPVGSRALSTYEEVNPLRRYNSPSNTPYVLPTVVTPPPEHHRGFFAFR